MRYYNFDRLIDKYSAEFVLRVKSVGSYVGGHYQVGSTNEALERLKNSKLGTVSYSQIENGYVDVTLVGAIISFSQNKIYQSGGYLTSQDRNLYIKVPLKGAMEGSVVIFNNNTYSIEEDTESGNERFTGVYSYVLKWVSSLDKL